MDLIPLGTVYGARLNQVDWRLGKSLSLPGARRLRLNVDVFNLLNASTVLNYNNTFGPSWQYPTLILGARLVKFSGQLDF